MECSAEQNQAPEIARVIVDKAREHGFLGSSIVTAAELAQTEKRLLSVLAVAVRERLEMKKRQQLDYDEINALFTFVYAKACEVGYQWYMNSAIPELSIDGLFTAQVPCRATPGMFEYFNSRDLPGEMTEAFREWVEANPDYCAELAVHPILPLLEALKWTYRISLSMALDYLETEE